MKNRKKKDLLLILALVLVAAALLFAGIRINQSGEKPNPAQSSDISLEEASPAESGSEAAAEAEAGPQAQSGQEAESTAGQADAESSGADDSDKVKAAAAAFLEENPAESYVVITSSQGSYTPIPLDQERTFKFHYGETEYNLIHTGVNSVCVEESTCENQNCVGQGEVTLENRDHRALGGMIICLPHGLTLELLDKDETEQYLLDYYTALQEEILEAAAAEAETAGEGAVENAS